jgi:hypothetical protein
VYVGKGLGIGFSLGSVCCVAVTLPGPQARLLPRSACASGHAHGGHAAQRRAVTPLPPSHSHHLFSLCSIDFLRGLAGDVYKNTTTSLAKEQAKAAAAAKPARDAAKKKAK